MKFSRRRKVIKHLYSITDEQKASLIKKGLPEDKINEYTSVVISYEKMSILADLYEHYEIYSFIPFTLFEYMNIDQLNNMCQWVHEYADGIITEDILKDRVKLFMKEQNQIIHNRSSIYDKLNLYMNEEIISYLDKIVISVGNRNDMLWCSSFEIKRPKNFRIFVERIEYEMKKESDLYLYDKSALKLEFYPMISPKEKVCEINLDFKELIIECPYDMDKFKQVIKSHMPELTYDPKVQYDILQQIKCQYQRNHDMNRVIKRLIYFLDGINDGDCSEILSTFLDRFQVCQMIIHEAELGNIGSIKNIIQNYDMTSGVEYFHLDGYGNIENFTDDLIHLIFSDIEDIYAFRTYVYGYEENTANQLIEPDARDRELLIKKCQENIWLEIDYEEKSLSFDDYTYSFKQCETEADLMNIFEYGNWALRDGFIYKDLAFIQQVNGGDEYWTLIKDEDTWIDFESVSFQPSIKAGKFYEFLDRIYELGVEMVERNHSRAILKDRFIRSR